jgi:hypothetical protein
MNVLWVAGTQNRVILAGRRVLLSRLTQRTGRTYCL